MNNIIKKLDKTNIFFPEFKNFHRIVLHCKRSDLPLCDKYKTKLRPHDRANLCTYWKIVYNNNKRVLTTFSTSTKHTPSPAAPAVNNNNNNRSIQIKIAYTENDKNNKIAHLENKGHVILDVEENKYFDLKYRKIKYGQIHFNRKWAKLVIFLDNNKSVEKQIKHSLQNLIDWGFFTAEKTVDEIFSNFKLNELELHNFEIDETLFNFIWRNRLSTKYMTSVYFWPWNKSTSFYAYDKTAEVEKRDEQKKGDRYKFEIRYKRNFIADQNKKHGIESLSLDEQIDWFKNYSYNFRAKDSIGNKMYRALKPGLRDYVLFMALNEKYNERKKLNF